MTCENCTYFNLANGALYVGECKENVTFTHIEPKTHNADNCPYFIKKDEKENGRK